MQMYRDLSKLYLINQSLLSCARNLLLKQAFLSHYQGIVSAVNK